jgi:bacillithiol biosynthesis cysteine-adding enzyme BshC
LTTDQLQAISALTKRTWIDFRQIPVSSSGFSQIFYDYVYEFAEVSGYFPYDFRDPDVYHRALTHATDKDMDRDLLARVLLRQNTAFGCGEEVLKQVTLLKKPTTFAVVTGQQVGLFGGPMYSVFKAITAIKLCRRLKSSLPHFDFVPLFWLEGEDHDFEEVSHVGVINGEGAPVQVRYTHSEGAEERNLGPIGELPFTEQIQKALSDLQNSLQKTEFTPGLIEGLRKSYAPGSTFNQAFVDWMNGLFGDQGLAYVTANDRELKQRMSPLFVKEISSHPRTSQLVIARSAELEENYHAQIKAKPVNLFMFHRGGRYLIEPRENDFSLKGTRHFISPDEMMSIAQERPELLSPNVVLRPIVQDWILPTVAYVGGPSEIAYHAQLQPVYQSFGVPQPVLYPRASASFVEERLERLMDKYQIEVFRFFEEGSSLVKHVLTQMAEINLEEVFGRATKSTEDVMNELQFALKEIDPTLLGPLESTRGKATSSLAVLKDKAFAAQQRKNDTVVRQLERGTSSLLPNGGLQERELSLLYYMNKYGPDLPKWLMDELDITGFRHQIITV